VIRNYSIGQFMPRLPHRYSSCKPEKNRLGNHARRRAIDDRLDCESAIAAPNGCELAIAGMTPAATFG
jgi:hypothetical protein